VILASEFETLVQILKSEGKITSSLEKWFVRNENMVPPVYILQPISTFLPHFNDPGKPILQKEHRANWWKLFEEFQELFRVAALKASEKGMLQEKEVLKYFISG